MKSMIKYKFKKINRTFCPQDPTDKALLLSITKLSWQKRKKNKKKQRSKKNEK
jgi:hypothetical protein